MKEIKETPKEIRHLNITPPPPHLLTNRSRKGKQGTFGLAQSICPACMKPWTQSPVLHKLGMLVHA